MQKIPFGRKVDGLQNDSTKFEIEDVPSFSTNKDDYLQAILSSKPAENTITMSNQGNNCTGDASLCSCYKCKRQRRRAGNRMDTTRSNTTLEGASEVRNIAPRRSNTLPSSLPRRSNTVRKTPTLKSYERHMPKPTYSQQESIYRFDKVSDKEGEGRKGRLRASTTNPAVDDYKISWEDDRTGDNLLTSLVTFQSIFETTDKNEGLSELLEQKAKELKEMKVKKPEEPQVQLPPRRPDCLTLSYRQGPQHNPLTLYHTMKMTTTKERGDAYNLAFQHCVQSDGGLRHWINKEKRPPPTKGNSTLIQPINQKSRRSIFSSIRRNYRASRQPEEQPIYWSSNEQTDQSEKSTESLENQPTDILLAAQALLPNQQDSITIKFNNKAPYEHIDVPGRPRNQSDKDSATSLESNTATRIASKSSRLFSSLSRKASMKSCNSSDKSVSAKSLEKVNEGLE
ncbi:unnamed protein product [Rhizopus stolonifer]